MGHERKSAAAFVMTALPPAAEVQTHESDVHFVAQPELLCQIEMEKIINFGNNHLAGAPLRGGVPDANPLAPGQALH
jgi:hypothetical protein